MNVGADDPAADSPGTGLWETDPGTITLWDRLQPGVSITIVKCDARGVETARYPGVVSPYPVASPWCALMATWTMREVLQGGLAFIPGDTLHEYFSAEHPYNAFAVSTPARELRGWYANVAWPTRLTETSDGLVLTWQDLILDIVVLPNGSIAFLDEHELAGSELEQEHPELVRAIVAARDHLAGLASRWEPPFFNPTPRDSDR